MNQLAFKRGEHTQVSCPHCRNEWLLLFDGPFESLRCPQCRRFGCEMVEGQVIDYWDSEVDLLDLRCGYSMEELRAMY